MIEWFKDTMGPVVRWLGERGWWVALVSVVLFLVSLLLIRHFIIRIPKDYFLHSKPVLDGRKHPTVGFAILIGRNLVGFILLLMGLIMSLPGVVGQGILTILIALSLMDFPGKRKLELKIIRQRVVLGTINSIRSKAGKPPLELPEEGKT